MILEAAIIDTCSVSSETQLATLIGIKAAMIEGSVDGNNPPYLQPFVDRALFYAAQAVEIMFKDA